MQKVLTNPSPLVSAAAKPTHDSVPKLLKCRSANLSHVLLVHPPRASHGAMRMSHHVVVACDAKDPGPREEPGALETALKLCEAMKQKNVQEISDLIAEKRSCFSNFVSTFRPFPGKEQVPALFSSLMKNMEFVVKQTLDEGMVIGVSWKLEWKKRTPLLLGKGFGIYMSHVYRGKVMIIKNVKTFLEPLLHIEPLRLKVIGLVMNTMEKLNPKALSKGKARKAISTLFILFFLAAFAFFLKHKLSP